MPSPSEDIPGVVQTDFDTSFGVAKPRIAPWDQAATYGEPGVREGEQANRMVRRRWDVSDEIPVPDRVVRRTPQQRLASLTKRLVTQYERTGTLPKTVLDQLAAVVGDVTNRQITGDDLEVLARWHLQEAYKRQLAEDQHLVVNELYSTPEPKVQSPVITGS